MNKAPQRSDTDKPASASKSASSPAKRESEQRVFDHLEEWANSSGLQPPK